MNQSKEDARKVACKNWRWKLIAAGYTQISLSKEAGISQSKLSRIISGSPCSDELFKTIEDLLSQGGE